MCFESPKCICGLVRPRWETYSAPGPIAKFGGGKGLGKGKRKIGKKNAGEKG